MPWQALKNAIGLSAGGGLRAALDQLKETLGFETSTDPEASVSSVTFTIALIALAAKMSKADGVASDIEVRAFKQQFSVPPGECANVNRLFALASQDVAGFESYASQINRILGDDKELKISVLECLFHIASADGVLHPAEDEYLEQVATRLGLSDREFRCVRRAFVVDPDSPYEILNVAPDANDAEIKARYRELVKSHHPDTLLSKGVPSEYLAAAQRRLAAITAAYDAVLIERGQRAERALESSP